MPITFEVKEHKVRRTPVVEILLDGKVVGVIYPAARDGIRIISAHIAEYEKAEDFAGELTYDSGEGQMIPIPAISIVFHPGPYEIREGKLIKKGH